MLLSAVHRLVKCVLCILITYCSLASAELAEYQKCMDCHSNEVNEWKKSHHSKSMQKASAQSVLANFSNQAFQHNGIHYLFSKSENAQQYFVTTTSLEGDKEKYEILYTFGFTPLQQYLVRIEGGRLQALQVAWDSRPKSVGGQKWFHLLPEENIEAVDRLHWQGPLFNWNAMCADCHSSGVERNFDTETNSFSTHWNEINVSCQSCHGDTEAHLSAMQGKIPSTDQTNTDKGFNSGLGEPVGVWQFSEHKDTAELVPSNSLTSNPLSKTQTIKLRQKQIDVCAACHSRRSPLTEKIDPSLPYSDQFELELLSPITYHHDGQIKDEVFVYGSFLQSKMFHAGVTCTDCHKPHSMELKIEGNSLCAQCHKPQVFDTPKHHHHQTSSEGSQCVNCHMPETNYMVVDPRRDHSIKVPSPSLQTELNSPNTCNRCHTDKNADWSINHLKQWFKSNQQQPHYGEAFQAINNRENSAIDQTKKQLQTKNLPDIVRASLIAQLKYIPSNDTLDILIDHLSYQDDLVVLGALKGLSSFPANYIYKNVAPLLESQSRSIRIEAVRTLSKLPEETKKQLNQTAYKNAKSELLSAGAESGARGESLVNLSNFYTNETEYENAIKHFQLAMDNDPAFAPAYVNLADLYRALGNEENALKILQTGIKTLPENADLLHAYGLALVRTSQKQDSLIYLKKAADNAIENAHYQYVYAVALNQIKDGDSALQHLNSTLKHHNHDEQLLTLGLQISLSLNQRDSTLRYARKLLEIYPNDEKLGALVRKLDSD